jgi:hypothetical protein
MVLDRLWRIAHWATPKPNTTEDRVLPGVGLGLNVFVYREEIAGTLSAAVDDLDDEDTGGFFAVGDSLNGTSTLADITAYDSVLQDLAEVGIDRTMPLAAFASNPDYVAVTLGSRVLGRERGVDILFDKDYQKLTYLVQDTALGLVCTYVTQVEHSRLHDDYLSLDLAEIGTRMQEEERVLASLVQQFVPLGIDGLSEVVAAHEKITNDYVARLVGGNAAQVQAQYLTLDYNTPNPGQVGASIRQKEQHFLSQLEGFLPFASETVLRAYTKHKAVTVGYTEDILCAYANQIVNGQLKQMVSNPENNSAHENFVTADQRFNALYDGFAGALRAEECILYLKDQYIGFVEQRMTKYVEAHLQVLEHRIDTALQLGDKITTESMRRVAQWRPRTQDAFRKAENYLPRTTFSAFSSRLSATVSQYEKQIVTSQSELPDEERVTDAGVVYTAGSRTRNLATEPVLGITM